MRSERHFAQEVLQYREGIFAEAIVQDCSHPVRLEKHTRHKTYFNVGSESSRKQYHSSRLLGTASALEKAFSARGTSTSEGNLRGSDSSRLLGTASALREALGGRSTPTSEGNPRGSDGPSREGTPTRGLRWRSTLREVRRDQDFPQAALFSNRDPSRVRPINENVVVLLPQSYHALPQDTSVILVTDPMISPRSRIFSLVVPCQRVGQIWFMQIL